MVQIGEFQLKSPLIIGSNDRIVSLADFTRIKNNSKNLGAFVTKSITLKPREGNADPIVAVSRNNLLVASGMRNPGAERVFRDIEKYNASFTHGDPLLIPSIASDPDGKYSAEKELAILALGLTACGSKIVELNLSCPNLNTHNVVAEGGEKIFKIIEYLRNEYEKKGIKGYSIIAKLAGSDQNILDLAKHAQRGGAGAITVLPLLRAIGFHSGVFAAKEVAIGTPLLGNKIGSIHGAGLGPVTMNLLAQLRAGVDIPLIASGGCIGGCYSTIEEQLDGLIQAIMVGAVAVEAVTPFYPLTTDKLAKIESLYGAYQEFLNEHNLTAIELRNLLA